ncbi:type IV pilus assembly protein PilM [Candidatus Gottesmanbacteria bacterium]|nr:type IV pilus assembly protein PilM [Candidatus Gottesmanbacteria bacterium]
MNTLIGLDIGSNTLKIVELSKAGKTFSLINHGFSATPPGGMVSENPVEQEAVAQAIKKLVRDSKVSDNEVKIALPESQVFTFVIETPALSERELASSIRWEAEQYIPVPLDEVTLDWKILFQGSKENEKNQVLLVGAPKRITLKYQRVLELAGLVAVSLETELIAATRSLSASLPTVANLMVVNMGAGTTDFSIVRQGVLAFTRSVGTGGMSLTRAVKQDLQLEEGQAEEYKKTYGLDPNQLEGKVYRSLKPLIDSILSEMKKGIGFFQEKNPNDKLEVIVLSGGSSLLPGIVPYFAETLGVETQVGNPLSSISNIDKKTTPIGQSEASMYTVAIGLAMRES